MKLKETVFAFFLVLLLASLGTVGSNVVKADSDYPKLVSVSADGKGGNAGSFNGVISSDGRYIAFMSFANNLVQKDLNPQPDVFVRDLTSSNTKLVSKAADGTGANGQSSSPSISGDGRYISFVSSASNLVPNDSNGFSDIFVYDQNTGQTKRVSITSNGQEANGNSYDPSISADGKFVVFFSDATNLDTSHPDGNIFIHDITTGKTTGLGITGYCGFCTNSISENGRYIAFISDQSGIVEAQTSTNGDIFVYDTQASKVIYVSVPADGVQANEFSDIPSISNNGNYVSFSSDAPNLVQADENGKATSIFVRDLVSGTTTLVSINDKGKQIPVSNPRSFMNKEGNIVSFSNDDGIFVYNQQTGKATALGLKGELTSISLDGKFAVFNTDQKLNSADTNTESDVYVMTTNLSLAPPPIQPAPEPTPQVPAPPPTPQTETPTIPSWIKSNAGWWSSGEIGDSDFIQGIQWLITNGIMKIPKTETDVNATSQQIPSWIKSNAGWWASGEIGDSDFVQGIQWLITNGIMKV